MSEHLPIIVIELLLIFGGAVGFGVWQLRELKRLRQGREGKGRDREAHPEGDQR